MKRIYQWTLLHKLLKDNNIQILHQSRMHRNQHMHRIYQCNKSFNNLNNNIKSFKKYIINYQININHQKKNYQKINKQLTHLKQLKFQLLDDLGLHHNAGFIDITQKYRKDVQDFAQDSARMHRQLQQKSQIIKRKQKQNHELILNFATKQQSLSQRYQQKMTQLMKKQILVQKKLQQSSQKQQQYRFQILRLKDIIIDIRKQLQQKNHKLFQQQSIIDKFNKMRKLHLEFRKVMVENYRNGMTHLNNTTQSSNNITMNNNTYASTSTGGVSS